MKRINNNKKTLELLAPAGDSEKLKYALAYGADAVYLGLPEFSLRAKTDFDFNSLKKGIAAAHSKKKKVYLTINIFAHEKQIKNLPQFLKQLKSCQPDAIILSDAGVLELVKKYLPKTPIHLSTQANTLNSAAVKFWQKNGVKRIILGREATLADIKKIHLAVPRMELEVFVHGAMCMSYSGRCYLSAWLSDRSANEGLCTQPCRWDYRVYLEEPLRPGKMIPIEEDAYGTYIMNSKDLCLIDYLSDLAKAGVTSFKIEGRTKSVYYVAVVTKVYKEAIDLIGKKQETRHPPMLKLRRASKIQKLKLELQKIDNRGYTTGFLFGTEGASRQNFKTSKAKSDWQFVGEIVEVRKVHKIESNTIKFKPHNMLRAGEVLELLTPTNCYRIKVKEFYDDKDKALKEVHGGTTRIYSFTLPDDYGDLEWGILRKKIN
jgi:putative protease